MITELATLYNKYIACLNSQNWPQLGQFAGDDVTRNGQRFGRSG
jgi:predicted ester cyclase